MTLIVALIGATQAWGGFRPESSYGPDVSYTGAPAAGAKPAEFNCTLCHSRFDGENLNTPGGSVQILGLPVSYQPGALYSIQVRLATDSTASFPTRRWGFQLTAVRESDGEGCGTFVLPSPDSLQALSGHPPFATRRYVEHRLTDTHPGAPGPVAWSFSWRAPDSPEGAVWFSVAGNAVNGTEDPDGDFVFTTQVRVGASTVAVEPASAALCLEPPRPNPATGPVRLRYSIPSLMRVRLEIFDLRGRRVRTLVRGERPAGANEVAWRGDGDHGEAIGPGVYWVRLTTPVGERQARLAWRR
jgi:hypothetical protein